MNSSLYFEKFERVCCLLHLPDRTIFSILSEILQIIRPQQLVELLFSVYLGARSFDLHLFTLVLPRVRCSPASERFSLVLPGCRWILAGAPSLPRSLGVPEMLELIRQCPAAVIRTQ